MPYRSQYQILLQKNEELQQKIKKLEKLLVEVVCPVEALCLVERATTQYLTDELLDEFERTRDEIRKYFRERNNQP